MFHLVFFLLLSLWTGISFSQNETYKNESYKAEMIPEIMLYYVGTDSVGLWWYPEGEWENIDDYVVKIQPGDCSFTNVTFFGGYCIASSAYICEDFSYCTELNISVTGNSVTSYTNAITAPPAPTKVSLETTHNNATCLWELPNNVTEYSCFQSLEVTLITCSTYYYQQYLVDDRLSSWSHLVTACDIGAISCTVELFGGSEGRSDPRQANTNYTSNEAGSLIWSIVTTPDPANIKVSWTLDIDCNRINGYSVSWIDEEGGGGKEKVKSTSYTIQGLVACVTYNVTVQPLMDDSIPLSLPASKISTTTPKTPEKPDELTCSDPTSQQEFLVSWKPPQHKECVKGYSLEYSGDVLWSNETESDVIGLIFTSYKLKGLTPYTRYNVCVAGVIGNGSKGLFDCCSQVTDQEAPGIPASFNGNSTSHNVHLFWEAPIEMNGVINGYLITQIGEEPEKTEHISGNETETVINGLSSDTTYIFMLQAQTEGGLGEAIDISLKTSIDDLSGSGSNVVGIVSGVLVSVLLIALVALVCFFKRDKVRQLTDKVAIPSSTISHKNHDMENLGQHISHPQPTSAEEFNRHRNNFIIILPYDEVRIMSSHRIQGSDDAKSSDTMSVTPNVKFITTKGPEGNAVEDFWRMVWQSDCQCMVMLTNLREREKEKRFMYWPDPDEGSMSAGKFTIHNQSEEECVLYTTRCLEIEGVKTRRPVTLYHFTAWPAFGVPSHEHQLLDFLSFVRKNVPKSAIPVVVHCSKDVGQVVTFISAWSLIDDIMNSPENLKVDIKTTVVSMEENLPIMVLSQEQYLYLCKCIIAFMDGQHKWDMTYDEGIYENIDDLQFAEPQYDIVFQHGQDGAFTNPGFHN